MRGWLAALVAVMRCVSLNTGSAVNADGDNRFVIPRAGERPIVVTGFPQFVRTRGAAYGFLPSITGIRHLAAG